MNETRTAGRWLVLIVFSFAAFLLFGGGIASVVELVHSGHFASKPPGETGTVHHGAGAIAMLVLCFGLAVGFLVGGICYFRETRKQ
jgi:hypothetical protein